MKVYIGADRRERAAYEVAERSLRRHASCPLEVTPLDIERLAATGLLRRLVDRRDGNYDLISNAPASTDFAISRFLVPHLAQTGWALFVDADVVFMTDVAEILQHADPDKALHVVKHNHVPTGTVKMDGQVQTAYPRKNWSSVMLWNCDHAANRRLSLQDVNTRRGLELHGFYWLNDAEIGELPPEWNWLVDEQLKPPAPRIAHFTLGTPDMPGRGASPHSHIWLEEAGR
jgi:hypothetical protein